MGFNFCGREVPFRKGGVVHRNIVTMNAMNITGIKGKGCFTSMVMNPACLMSSICVCVSPCMKLSDVRTIPGRASSMLMCLLNPLMVFRNPWCLP